MVCVSVTSTKILLELMEFPSILILFCNFIKSTLIHKYIGKNFSAPKIFTNIFMY